MPSDLSCWDCWYARTYGGFHACPRHATTEQAADDRARADAAIRRFGELEKVGIGIGIECRSDPKEITTCALCGEQFGGLCICRVV